MQALIVASSTAPTVAQKYPRAHMCCPQYRFRSSGNSACRFRLDRPLMYCASFAGDSTGGADDNRCMWSGDTAPRMITTPRLADLADQIALAPLPDRAVSCTDISCTRLRDTS